MAVVLGAIRTAMASAADARRVRRAIEPGGFMGQEPADGETIAVAGSIRPVRDALIAPFLPDFKVVETHDIYQPFANEHTAFSYDELYVSGEERGIHIVNDPPKAPDTDHGGGTSGLGHVVVAKCGIRSW